MEGVRPATESDVDRLVELAQTMRADMAEARGGRLWALREQGSASNADDLISCLQEMDVDAGKTRVVLGTFDGAAIGFAIGVIEKMADDTLLGVITDLFVEEQAREVGVGEAMLTDLVTFFTEHNCVGIDAIALPGDRSTKNFFEEQGFKARLLQMHHTLELEDRDGTLA